MRSTPILALSALAMDLCLASWAGATCTRSFAPVANGSFRDLFFEAATAMVALPDGGVLVGGKHHGDGAALVRMDAQGRVDRAFSAMTSEPEIFGRVEAIFPEGRGFLVYGAFTDLMATRFVGLFRIDADGRIDREGLADRWGEDPDPPESIGPRWPAPAASPRGSWTPQSAAGTLASGPLLFVPPRLDAVALEPRRAVPEDVLSWPILPAVARFDARVLLGGDAIGQVTGAHGLADGSWIVRGERGAPDDDPVLLWSVGPVTGKAFQEIRARDLRAAAGVTPRILASAVLTDGTVVIGGTFTSVRGVPRRHIACLRPDGSLDR